MGDQPRARGKDELDLLYGLLKVSWCSADHCPRVQQCRDRWARRSRRGAGDGGDSVA